MSLAGDIRRVLAESGGAGLREICRRLDIPEAAFEKRKLVYLALRDMIAAGRVELVESYRLTGKEVPRGRVQEKIWRAMCLKASKGQTFEAAEIILLTGADADYVKRYIRHGRRLGLVEAVGRRREVNALVYRVVPGREHEAAPPFNRRALTKARDEAKAQANQVEAEGRKNAGKNSHEP